jgi:hypothetical protein
VRGVEGESESESSEFAGVGEGLEAEAEGSTVHRGKLMIHRALCRNCASFYTVLNWSLGHSKVACS